jgi:peptidoglycan/LPS O-acetylase OafA/YrhL
MHSPVEGLTGPHEKKERSSARFYIPELDGLRCVAILGVVLFHLKVPGMSFGGLGVWLFFVLSGYLITRILLGELSLGGGIGPFLGRFYCRRALRIFPLYYVYLAITYVLLVVSSNDPHDYIYFVTYTQNFLLGASHFADQPSVLWHTWSLAIEEQFYLIWPFLVYYLSRRTLTVACSLVVLGAPIYRYWVLATTGNPYLTYTIPIGSADSLALGCLCALHWDYIVSSNRKIAVIGAGVSIALLVGLISAIGPERFWDVRDWVQHPIQFVVLSVAAVAFSAIMISVPGFSWTGILRHPTVVHIGQISYGIYMWHGLASVFTMKLLEHYLAPAPGEWLRIGVSLLVTYLISLASYRYLEAPFLRVKGRFYASKKSESASPYVVQQGGRP